MTRAEAPKGSTDDWFTPLRVFEEHQRRTGMKYAVDVTGHHEAPVSLAIGDWLSRSSLNENVDWCPMAGSGVVWCNPPYSGIAPWVGKAVDQVAKHGLWVTMLLPSWTDRKWWQEHVEPFRDGHDVRGSVICSTLHLPRFKFGYPGDPTGKLGMSPTFGCVLVDFWRDS